MYIYIFNWTCFCIQQRISTCLVNWWNIFCFKRLFSYIHPVFIMLLYPSFQATTLAAPPPIMVRLVKDPIVKQYDLSSVQTLITGAAPLSSSLIHELETKLKVIIRQSMWADTFYHYKDKTVLWPSYLYNGKSLCLERQCVYKEDLDCYWQYDDMCMYINFHIR